MEENVKVYLFGKYLADEMRRAICNAEYRPAAHKSHLLLADGRFCPLGVLHHAGLLEYYRQPSAPGGETVALAIEHSLDYSMPSSEIKAIAASVDEFTEDWDNGRITPEDLPYAIGLIEAATPSGSKSSCAPKKHRSDDDST